MLPSKYMYISYKILFFQFEWFNFCMESNQNVRLENKCTCKLTFKKFSFEMRNQLSTIITYRYFDTRFSFFVIICLFLIIISILRYSLSVFFYHRRLNSSSRLSYMPVIARNLLNYSSTQKNQIKFSTCLPGVFIF